MPNDIKYSAPASIQTVMADELIALSNGQRALAAAAIDNAAALDQFGDFELAVTFDDPPNPGGAVWLWLLPSLDGTHFADGDGSVTEPQAHLQVGCFRLRSDTTAQRLHLRGVVLPPFKFKPLLLNESGQPFPYAGAALRLRTYNDQVQ